MHTHNKKAFIAWESTAKHIFRTKIYPLGIHQRWSADGHDKLYKIGFPIWAIIDEASSHWLDGWIILSNWMGNIVVYLWLCNVEKYGGIWSRLSSAFILADPYIVLEQHLTVICGLALGQFPRYKSKCHGLTQRRRQDWKNGWVQIVCDYTSQLSGESKRIRLEYKYATRGFIY